MYDRTSNFCSKYFLGSSIGVLRLTFGGEGLKSFSSSKKKKNTSLKRKEESTFIIIRLLYYIINKSARFR